MSPAREVELKLEVPAHSFYRLARSSLLRTARKTSSKPATLVSVYFDTDKLKLRNKGLSLRVRRIGRRHVQTIKRENGESAALFARDEWEHPISGRQPDLDVAQDAALGPVFGKKVRRGLKPIFETRVRRTVYPIQSGVSEIELTVDKGKVEAGRQSSPLCEVELELKRGESAELFKLARMLDRGSASSACGQEQGRARVHAHRRRGAPAGKGGTGRADARLQPASRISSHCQGVSAPTRRQSTRHTRRGSRGIAPNAGRSSAFAGGGLAVCRHAC